MSPFPVNVLWRAATCGRIDIPFRGGFRRGKPPEPSPGFAFDLVAPQHRRYMDGTYFPLKRVERR